MNKEIDSKKNFPWYDSAWLGKYNLAQDIIRKDCPEELERFIEGFSILKTSSGFEEKLISDIFNKYELQESRDLIDSLAQKDLENHEFFSFGRFVLHNHKYFNALQEKLIPLVSELVNEPVETSYNFLSLYNDFGVCDVHLDALSAKWTLDICINQSAPWPIFVNRVKPWPDKKFVTSENWNLDLKKDPDNNFQLHSLNSGEGIIFSGSSQWHYRDRMTQNLERNFCHLILFHYIPKGTKDLIRPANWASIFNIPSLKNIGAKYNKLNQTDTLKRVSV